MKNDKIKQVFLHIGVNIHQKVLTGVNADVHQVEIEFYPKSVPSGVMIKSSQIKKFIPFTNITSVELYIE